VDPGVGNVAANDGEPAQVLAQDQLGEIVESADPGGDAAAAEKLQIALDRGRIGRARSSW
jgi:hypothetical protein